MANIDFSSYFSNNNNYSNIFSSLNANNNTQNSSGGFLTDWASLKNGSYGKLTKAYYGKAAQESLDADEVKDSLKANNTIKAGNAELRDALKSITGDSDLFTKKITSKDSDGNDIETYDYDKIYKALKAFADGYNAALDKGVDSDNKTVLRNTLQMTKTTASHANVLSRVGITIGKDNKLSVDEASVKKANIDSLKGVFSGMTSYAEFISNNANNNIAAIERENNKLSNYNSSGKFSGLDSIGNIYDGSY